MSLPFLNAAFAVQTLSPIKKWVLVALSDYANEEGYAFPSITTLMRKTSLSKQPVVDALKKLLSVGFIQKVDNAIIPKMYLKRANQNCFWLNLEKLSSAKTSLVPRPVLQRVAPPVLQIDLNDQYQPSKETRSITVGEKKRIVLQDEKAWQAWVQVKKAMTHSGASKKIAFDDPVIDRVIHELGTWSLLCRSDMRELPFLERRFLKTYLFCLKQHKEIT